MSKRTIRDTADARRCLAAAESSGLSRSDWARRNGVDGRSLYAWSRKLAPKGKAKSAKRRAEGRSVWGMVELIPDAPQAGGRYLIRCGQLAVEVDERFDEATLSRLLKVIAAC